MAQNKTLATEASVESYLSAIEDEARRKDCEDLAKLMTKATKQQPIMWGTSIVGFGSYHYKSERSRQEGDWPLVVDADGLNCLAQGRSRSGIPEGLPRRAPTVLTPHPGEAARLLGVSATEIQANRIESARKLGMQFRAHVALKGAGTVIAHPDGCYAINTSGGPWLAQAGSGDRLTGMVAALLGQGMAAGNALEAAVWLHGRA